MMLNNTASGSGASIYKFSSLNSKWKLSVLKYMSHNDVTNLLPLDGLADQIPIPL